MVFGPSVVHVIHYNTALHLTFEFKVAFLQCWEHIRLTHIILCALLLTFIGLMCMYVYIYSFHTRVYFKASFNSVH
jgi:hypothetical protein